MKLEFNDLKAEAIPNIVRSFQEQGWNKPAELYENYLKLQQEKKRKIIVAFIQEANQNVFAGYLTIQWQSNYLPFKKAKIPEIVDLNVLKIYQRRGIASRLIQLAEASILEHSNTAGIGFGLVNDYGAAQRLYVRLGYIPDGRGIIQDNKTLHYGDQVTLGDGPVLYLTKVLV